MPDERSLFERLDSIESNGIATNKMLAELLDALKEEPNGESAIEHKQPTREELFHKYLCDSKKSWRWFGTKSEFKRSKATCTIAAIMVIIFGVLSSIISTICFNLYSTFTFFENIWLVFTTIVMVYISHNDIECEINDLARHSFQKYKKDKVGMLFPEKTKTVFTFFKWFALISVALNIVCIWFLGKDVKLLATFFEVLFLGSVIFSTIFNFNFFAQYSIIRVEGCYLDSKEKLVLVLPPLAKELITEKEFKEKMPDFYK